MAFSKFQLGTFLIINSLLVTCQSKILNTKQIGHEECVYRGQCQFSRECKSRCGPPEFSHETIGLCMLNYHDNKYRCCCTSNN
ncbi:PREDICTED: defensin-like protein 275 [Camelina sativa]|uniref:Defensin-like protein 275 n=1 Tax=Camelina sativa TaxID=90675 RepID=A0ABM1QXN2_CAMSA|nr:PREDICTED: defensin-like protein 275 [Camelina sativa]